MNLRMIPLSFIFDFARYLSTVSSRFYNKDFFAVRCQGFVSVGGGCLLLLGRLQVAYGNSIFVITPQRSYMVPRTIQYHQAHWLSMIMRRPTPLFDWRRVFSVVSTSPRTFGSEFMGRDVTKSLFTSCCRVIK